MSVQTLIKPLTILFILPAIFACNRSPAGQPTADKPLRFLNGSEVRSLDPHRTSWMQDMRVIDALFEGLLTLNPQNLEPQAGCAEYPPTVSTDQRTYTFKIRPNARWSNGDPVTAQDFTWSWQRALDPVTGTDYVQLFFVIEGAEEYFNALNKFYKTSVPTKPTTQGGGPRRPDFAQVAVKALDDHTLQVRLRAPTRYFLDLCAFIPFVPLHRPTLDKFAKTTGPDRTEYQADWWQPGNLVNNGPFRLKSWQDRVQMVLERRPDYWDAANVVSQTFLVLPFEGQDVMFNTFEQGQADVMPAKAPKTVMDELMRQYRAGERKDVHPVLNFGTYFYRLNCTRPPFHDVRVRQAFNLAIDRATIAEKVKGHGEKPADVLVPPGTKDYVSPAGAGYNVEKARLLLAEAGFPEGRGFPLVSLVFNQEAGHLETAEVVKQMWKKNLGVDVKLEQVERVVLSERIKKIDYDISRGGWYGDYFDPMTFLEMFITQTGKAGNNDTGWSNPAYDRLISAGNVEPDAAQRNALLKQAETILCLEQVPIICVYTYADCVLFNPDQVKGVYPNLRMVMPFKYMGRK